MAPKTQVVKGNGSPQQREENKFQARAKVSIEHVVRIKTAYNALKDNYVVGADRAIEEVRKNDPDFPLKRDAVKGILARIKAGDAPDVIIASHGSGKGRKKTARAPAVVAAVKADIEADPNSLTNSQRTLARKHKVSATTINRILKCDLKKVVFRKVRTCVDKRAHAEERAKAARQITKKIDSGKWRRDEIWYSDESWFDTQGNRFNPQNERFYARAGAKKSDVDAQDALAAPQKQRAPGFMLHMTASAYAGGTVLAPHIVPEKVRLTAKYYVQNILNADVFPNIRGAAQATEGNWLWMQDLASPHTAIATQIYLKKG